MARGYDPAAMKKLTCPLCGSKGTLRPIRVGKRLRAGPFSYVRTYFKSHECTGCGATFSQGELLRDKQSR